MQAPDAGGVSVIPPVCLMDEAPWFEAVCSTVLSVFACFCMFFPSVLSLHHVSALNQLMYHKGNLKNNYFVLTQFFPNEECLPLCGQALISMSPFVLVWKRNRSTKQTEQK